MLESTEDGSYEIQSSSSSNKSRKIAAWVLVVILLVLLIVSLVINVMQAVRAHKRSCNRNQNTPPDCKVAMGSNPCYEASNVKMYEAQEAAVPVYEILNQ